MACILNLLNGDQLTVTDGAIVALNQSAKTTFVELTRSNGRPVFVAVAAVASFEKQVHRDVRAEAV